jgi:hypothetical protein
MTRGDDLPWIFRGCDDCTTDEEAIPLTATEVFGAMVLVAAVIVTVLGVGAVAFLYQTAKFVMHVLEMAVK